MSGKKSNPINIYSRLYKDEKFYYLYHERYGVNLYLEYNGSLTTDINKAHLWYDKK